MGCEKFRSTWNVKSPPDVRHEADALRRWRGISSLVEIMVIVISLGILVMASIANFSGARDRARVRTACSSLHNIHHVLMAYWTDKGEFPTGITSFDALYNALAPSGLDTNPQDAFDAFVSYSNVDPLADYRLVVKAKDSQRTALTAARDGIDAVAPDGTSYNELCN